MSGFRSSVKRSVIVSGHKTSLNLENAFWDALQEIAQANGKRLPDMLEQIEATGDSGHLSSSTRTFILDYYRRTASSEGP